MNQLKAELLLLWEDDSGASAAEYALILAIIGGALAAASLALGNSMATAMETTATCIDGGSSC